MIAHASPASGSFEETRNTLLYADRAKNIKTNVSMNKGSNGWCSCENNIVAFHQCGLGLNPDIDTICGSSLLLVLSLASRSRKSSRG